MYKYQIIETGLLNLVYPESEFMHAQIDSKTLGVELFGKITVCYKHGPAFIEYFFADVNDFELKSIYDIRINL